MRLKVGDYVRVREWEDMEAEFGLIGGPGTSIHVKFTFTRYMKKFCGEVFRVENIGAVMDDIDLFSEDDPDSDVGNFSFSEEMLRPVKAPTEIPIEDFMSVLKG